jgi:hypothetical protein
MFKRWTSDAAHRLGATFHLSEDSAALGAGTNLVLHYHEVWRTEVATCAILELDDSYPRNNKGITRRLVREFSQLNPVTSTLNSAQLPADRIVDWLKNNGFAEGAYEIFTDGS